MNSCPLLDTHIWIWWLHGQPELSSATRKILDDFSKKGERPFLSDMSLWEAQMLYRRGRIVLQIPFEEWLSQASSSVELLRITPNVILEVDRLPHSFHGDPADRIIVATAIAHRISLLTRDQKILDSNVVKFWKH